MSLLQHAYADLLLEGALTADEAYTVYKGVRDAGGSHEHACGGLHALTARANPLQHGETEDEDTHHKRAMDMAKDYTDAYQERYEKNSEQPKPDQDRDNN